MFIRNGSERDFPIDDEDVPMGGKQPDRKGNCDTIWLFV
jgi:hypothetical protein